MMILRYLARRAVGVVLNHIRPRTETEMTTCNECGKTWGGMRAEHCTACHQTFTGSTSGDMHRRGEFPDRYCTTEGLEFNAKRNVWKMPGTWIPADAVHEEATSGAAVGTNEGSEILSPEISDVEAAS